MFSRTLRGPVKIWLAPRNTDPPTRASDAPTGAWEEWGSSFFENGSVTFMRDQEIAREESLNELQPVGLWRETDVKRVAATVKDFSLETLQKIFNNNPITVTAEGGGAPAFRQMSLDSPINVATYALILDVEASPHDPMNPMGRTANYRVRLYFPVCGEVSNFETALGAKQTGMIPAEFLAIKSDESDKINLIQMVGAAPA